MAELIREDETLVLKLSTLEKVEGVHGDIRVPFTSVKDITILDDVIHAVHGMKFPGSRLPGVFAMGTFISREGKTFVIVHHQNKRGVKIKLSGESYNALIVGLDDPEKVAQSLGLSNS
ncbi:PH domain-containing protein [Pullulanibacillus sp. KACC 23026]|uniref:PH domain-containing protein n=1 Tax=Pullulanibacillus sp. KACC 23026 TaxID=3028315 RepID=UPI0023B1B382|nr:PH domain-containing protein [Pullulanibacillus sp. KACC 23026]WEG11272.1 PH domain-containing protein [Pullulanibacillus sp. KACC 23026]